MRIRAAESGPPSWSAWSWPADLAARFDRNFTRLLPVPAVVAVGCLVAFPLGYTLWLSLHQWYVSAVNRPRFVGLRNYVALIGADVEFWLSVGRTLAFTLLALGTQVVVGVALGLVFHRHFPARGLARSLLLLPMMATPAAAALVWVMMMNPTLGVLNYFLSLAHLPPSLWTNGTATVIPALVLVDTWEWSPLIALFCMAGLAAMPVEPFEAARIDGATAWQQFRFVTLPLLRPTLVVATLFRAIDALKSFDVIYVMAQGGPGHASETVNLYVFLQAFKYFQMGYASTILVVFFSGVLGVSLIFVRYRRAA